MMTSFTSLPDPFGDVVRLEDDGIAWDDIIIYPGALGTGASAPDLEVFAASGNLKQYAFAGSGATVEQLYGSFEIPHNYQEDTDLRPHLHVAGTVGAAGNCKFYMEYSIVNNNGTFPAPTTISVVLTPGGTAWVHKAGEFDIIAGAGLNIGAVCIFRVYRDPADVADTYGSDVSLLSIGIHYQIDSFGSKNVFTKD
jgi:hypothetical protein